MMIPLPFERVPKVINRQDAKNAKEDRFLVFLGVLGVLGG
jgi:hypothetical protein